MSILTLDDPAIAEWPLLDNEFDEETRIEEPEGLLFLLTDDPLHFNLS